MCGWRGRWPKPEQQQQRWREQREGQNNLGGPVDGTVMRKTREDAQVPGLFILWVVQSLH